MTWVRRGKLRPRKSSPVAVNRQDLQVALHYAAVLQPPQLCHLWADVQAGAHLRVQVAGSHQYSLGQAPHPALASGEEGTILGGDIKAESGSAVDVGVHPGPQKASSAA